MRKVRSIFLLFISVILISCVRNTKVYLTSIVFEDKVKELSVGESTFVNVSYLPSDATDVKIEYEVYPEGNVELSGFSNDGVVLTGIKSGSCVLIAKCDGRIEYLQINVNKTYFTEDPYIVLPYVTLEMEKGKRKTVIANLIGGNAGDNNSFVWNSSNEKVCKVDGLNNSAVLTAGTSGLAVIRVSHPKSLYDSEFIVYVESGLKELFYLTTESNSISLEPGSIGGFDVEIIGGVNSDYPFIKYENISGNDVFDIQGNNGTCSINAKKEGKGQIKISHPKCDVDLTINVIVTKKDNLIYINSSSDFVVINDKKTAVFECSVVGSTYDGLYSYGIENDNICSIEMIGNKFYVNPLKDGFTKIYVKNSITDFIKEIIVIVEGMNRKNESYYIQTSQNVIKTEVGADLITLYMDLIGGNESDRNAFEWEVNDSSILEISTNDGKVKYNRSAVADEKYEAKGYIRPVGKGVGKIKVIHPKADNEQTVDVYVYEEGTFSSVPLKIQGESLIKCITGERYRYTFDILQGKQDAEFRCSIDDSEIADVSIRDKTVDIYGKKSGITQLHISSDLMKKSYDVPLLVGNAEELNSRIVLSMNENCFDIEKGKFVYKQIKGSGNYDSSLNSVLCENPDICDVSVMDDILCIKAKEKGETDVIISNENADNRLKVYVNVTDAGTNFSKPYSINGEKYFGIVIGDIREYKVELIGAEEYKNRDLIFEYDANEIIDVEQNSNVLKIKALKEGNVKVKVTHPESPDIFTFYIYSASNETELNNRIVMNIDKTDYLIEENEVIYIKADINNRNENAKKIKWQCDNLDVINISSENDYCIVKGLKKGNSIVRVSIDGKLYYNLYISVVEKNTAGTEYNLKLPSVIETVVNKSIKINAELINISDNEIIEWKCDGANLISSSASCIFKAEKEGIYDIDVSIDKYDIKRRIKVAVYENEETLYSSFLIGLEKSVYRTETGNNIDVILQTGNRKLDDELTASLRWTSSDEEICRVTSNGLNGKVIPLKEGICEIKVDSDDERLLNNVIFKVEVVNKRILFGDIEFSGNKINSLLKNDVMNYEYHIYEKGREIEDYENVNLEYDEKILEINKANNSLRIRGKVSEESYVNLIYRDYEFRLLFSVKDELTENDIKFYFDRDIYLINKDEEFILNINYPGYLDFNDFVFNVKESDVISVEKCENCFRIRGLKTGNGILTVNYGNYQKSCHISVVENAGEPVDIGVESLIVLEVNENYSSNVVCAKNVFYKLEQTDIIDFVSNGNVFDIKGKKTGSCELKVYYENVCRIIKIIVAEDKKAVRDFNISNRRILLKKNNTVKIRPYCYGNFDLSQIRYTVISDNECIGLYEQNDNICIEGKTQGLAQILVEGNSSQILLDVIVLEENNSGGDFNIDLTCYLYTDKSYYNIQQGDDITLNCFVAGDTTNFSNGYFTWKCSDYSVCSIEDYQNGYMCSVIPKKEGSCIISVSNIQCSNVLNYKIVVSNEKQAVRYLKTDFNFVDLKYGGENKNVHVTFENINGNYEDVEIECKNSGIASCESVITNNGLILSFSPLGCGKAEFILRHKECDFESSVTVLVSEYNSNGSIVYLTTSNNYTLVRPGRSENVSVRLVNDNDANLNNYAWSILSGANYINLVGSGTEVQVYGVKEGFASIRCTYLKNNSSIDLYVSVSSTVSQIKYITTSENVIETYVSETLDYFNVDLIGSENADSFFSYKVSDPSVLLIIGNNNSCYYKGLKPGTAQITVTNTSDTSINELKITVIVMEQAVDGAYMKPSSTAVYLSKKDMLKKIDVAFENAGTINQDLIEWVIYSQRPSASGNGEVINIIGSGNECVIKPLNNGTAKIRCVYAPLGLFANISVNVSDNSVLNFTKKKVTVEEDDCIFVNVKLPDYLDDFSSYISYEVDNNDVCRVYGTSKVACIYGLKKGSAIVKIKNSFDNSYDELGIDVYEKKEMPYSISVSKSIISLNPRSKDVILNAFLVGQKLNGDENEELEWSIEGNECLSLYPGRGPSVMLKLNMCLDENDPDYGKVKSGSALIHIRHKKCPENYEKTIYVNVEEDQNYFILDKYSINIETGNVETVSATITNATTKDYSEILWSISGESYDSYGNPVEVARCLNADGRECSVYGLADGIVTLSAFYKGDIVQCEINVESGRIFKLNGPGTVNMFPDKGEEFSVEINYILKPAAMHPTWVITDSDSNKELLTFKEVPGKQAIRIYGQGYEGTATVTGFVSGVGTIKVYVNLVYDPYLGYYGNESISKSVVLEDIENENNNKAEFKFEFYPQKYYPNYSIICSNEEFKTGYINNEFIIDRDVEEGQNARGSLIVHCLKEIPREAEFKFKVELYKDASFKEKIGVDSLVYSLESAYYEDSGYDVYFRRLYGDYTHYGEDNEGFIDAKNNYGYDYTEEGKKSVKGSSDVYFKKIGSTNINENALNLIFGESEQHMIVAVPRHEGQYEKDFIIQKDDERNYLSNKDFDENTIYNLKIDSKNNGEKGERAFIVQSLNNSTDNFEKYDYGYRYNRYDGEIEYERTYDDVELKEDSKGYPFYSNFYSKDFYVNGIDFCSYDVADRNVEGIYHYTSLDKGSVHYVLKNTNKKLKYWQKHNDMIFKKSFEKAFVPYLSILQDDNGRYTLPPNWNLGDTGRPNIGSHGYYWYYKGNQYKFGFDCTVDITDIYTSDICIDEGTPKIDLNFSYKISLNENKSYDKNKKLFMDELKKAFTFDTWSGTNNGSEGGGYATYIDYNPYQSYFCAAEWGYGGDNYTVKRYPIEGGRICGVLEGSDSSATKVYIEGNCYYINESGSKNYLNTNGEKCRIPSVRDKTALDIIITGESGAENKIPVECRVDAISSDLKFEIKYTDSTIDFYVNGNKVVSHGYDFILEQTSFTEYKECLREYHGGGDDYYTSSCNRRMEWQGPEGIRFNTASRLNNNCTHPNIFSYERNALDGSRAAICMHIETVDVTDYSSSNISISNIELNNFNDRNIWQSSSSYLGNLEYLYPSDKSVGNKIGNGYLPFYVGNPVYYKEGIIIDGKSDLICTVSDDYKKFDMSKMNKYIRKNTSNDYDFFGNKQWVNKGHFGYFRSSDFSGFDYNSNTKPVKANYGNLILSYTNVFGDSVYLYIPYNTYLYNRQNNNLKLDRQTDCITDLNSPENPTELYNQFNIYR